MFDGMTDLIYDNDQKTQKLKNIENVVLNFSKIKMPSTLQYIKFVGDIKDILDIESK